MQAIKYAFFMALWLVSSQWAVAAVPRTVEQLNSHPPRIVVARQAARLMLIDGPPVPVEIPATALEFVVNTDWDVFHDRRTERWYVLDRGYWLEGNMLASGDWRTTTDLLELEEREYERRGIRGIGVGQPGQTLLIDVDEDEGTIGPTTPAPLVEGNENENEDENDE